MTASAAKSVVAAMIERPEKWHFLMKKWHTTYDRRHNTATIKRKGPKINKAFTIVILLYCLFVCSYSTVGCNSCGEGLVSEKLCDIFIYQILAFSERI